MELDRDAKKHVYAVGAFTVPRNSHFFYVPIWTYSVLLIINTDDVLRRPVHAQLL